MEFESISELKNTCAVCNAKLMERGKIVKAFTTEISCYYNSEIKGYGKFRAVCRLILEQIEHDIVLQGRSSKGLAYDIVSNVMDKYFGKRDGPAPKNDMKAWMILS